jgi:hypothetical protein
MRYFWLGARTFLAFFVMVYASVTMYMADSTVPINVWFSIWCVSFIVLVELLEKFERELK